MSVKKIALYLALALSIQTAFAQGVATIKGRVLSAADSTSLFATVMVNHGALNTMCRKDGTFTLVNVPRKTQTLEIVYLGYKPITAEIEVTSLTVDLGTIYMAEATNDIDEVVVVAPAPMSIMKGDTVQFNAAAFKTNPDADADELIMKMPGVVIQEGKVEAQGEPVRKIYVDGKLFFGSDPMAALKNLPADAIESIQLFDEPSEMSRYTGVEDGETTKAINIVTKTKTSKSDIFRMEASGGSDTGSPRDFRYLGGGNYSHFTEKQRVTITALSNNVNTARFGQGDLSTNGAVDSNGNPVNQATGINRITGLGANYTFDNKKVKLAASYFYDNIENVTERTSFSKYFPNPPKFDSKENYGNSQQRFSRDTHRAEMRFEWNVSPRDVIVITPRINYSQTDTHYRRGENLTIQDGDSLNRNVTFSPNKSQSFVVSGDALWTHRFAKRGRSFTASLRYNIDNRDYDRFNIDSIRQNYKSEEEEWRNSTLSNKYNNETVSSNLLRFKASYSEPFAKYHRILFNVIASRDWGDNKKMGYRFDKQAEAYTSADSNQMNHFNRDYTTFGSGLGYAFYNKKFNLSVNVDYQRLFQTREVLLRIPSYTSYAFNDVQPNVVFRYMLEKKKYLKFQYHGKTLLPRVDMMQSVLDDSSPSNLKIGNPDLKQGYQHWMTLFYNATNIEKSTNLTVTFTAQTISNFVAKQTEFMPTDRDTTIFISQADKDANKNGYTPQHGASLVRNVNLNGYFSMRFSTTYSIAIKAIRSNLNTSVQYNFIRTPSVYGQLNYANINSGGFRIGLTSNISQNVDFNIYSNTTFNYTSNTTRGSSSFITENLYGSVNVIFPHGIVFNTLATWKYYKSSNLDNFAQSYYLLNVGLGKKVFKRQNGEFRVTVYDLLDQNRNIVHSVRDSYIDDTYTNNMGRYVMARFTYRFNSLVHKRKPPTDIPAGANFKNVNVKELKQMSKPKNK